ncbi:hypothetical protein [Nocardiopsis rhodophaea]|uniref:CdiA C-terminal domain-containing protein n=1 Tax=Nocardiopsis rhodophaea TaxID=280238 RepID=UPI0031D4166E
MSDEPLINPGAITVPGIAADELESTAATLKSDGEDVAQAGQDIKSSWQGLSGVYNAPESEKLLAAINPIATTGDDFSDAMDKVGEALTTFAEKAGKMKKKLSALRMEAQDFIDNVASKEDWRSDPDNVTKHNDLIDQVGSQTAAYQNAERECANKITAIFGGTTFVPADRQECKPGEVGYGMGWWSFTDATPTPWGSPQTVDEPWYIDARDGAVDLAVETGKSLVGMVGIYGVHGFAADPIEMGANSQHFWTEAAGGVAALFGRDGNAGQAWAELGNSIVPVSEWDDRPGYTVVQGAANIGLMFVGGIGAIKAVSQGAKGAAGAARAARAAEGAALGAADDLAGAASAASRMPKAGGLPTVGEIAKTPNLWGPAAKGALKAALKDQLGLDFRPDVPTAGHHLNGGHGPAANDLPGGPTPHSPQTPAAEHSPSHSSHQPTESPATSAAGAERAPSHTTEPSTPTHAVHQADAPTTTQVQRNLDHLEELVKQNNGDDAALDQFARDHQPELVGAGARYDEIGPTASAGDGPGSSDSGTGFNGNHSHTPNTPGRGESGFHPATGGSTQAGAGSNLDSLGAPSGGGNGVHPAEGPGHGTSGGGSALNGGTGDVDPSKALLSGVGESVPHEARLPRPEDLPSGTRTHPTVDELRDRIGEGWEYYDAKERSIAEFLKEHGIEVRSVDVARTDGVKSPDSVIDGTSSTLEFKTVETSSKNALIQNIRKGREQSSRLAIDLRSGGTPQETAISGLNDALRRYGGDLKEVVLIGDGYVITWP